MSNNEDTRPDPTDDKMYENLSLTDFLRHFVPQEKELKKEIDKINETKNLPFIDPSEPVETPKNLSRSEKRQIELQKKKNLKKKDALYKKVEVLMNNPTALKKAIDDNPKIKDIAIRIQNKH